MSRIALLQKGIDHELVNERGTSLARAGERLERALAALAQAPTAAQREHLVLDAADALWHLLVQRDAIGPTRHEQIYQIYGVPPEVRARVGQRRS